jgi:hypothetical protein
MLEAKYFVLASKSALNEKISISAVAAYQSADGLRKFSR